MNLEKPDPIITAARKIARRQRNKPRGVRTYRVRDLEAQLNGPAEPSKPRSSPRKRRRRVRFGSIVMDILGAVLDDL